MGVMRSEAHGDLHRPNAGCISTLHCSCNCSCFLKFKIEDVNVHCTLLGKNDNAHVGEDAQNHWKKVQDTANGWCRWICRTLLKEEVLMVGNFDERGNAKWKRRTRVLRTCAFVISCERATFSCTASCVFAQKVEAIKTTQLLLTV